MTIALLLALALLVPLSGRIGGRGDGDTIAAVVVTVLVVAAAMATLG